MVGMMRRRGSVAESIPPTGIPVDAVVNAFPSAIKIPNAVVNTAGTEFYAHMIVESVYTGTSEASVFFGNSKGNLNIGMMSSKVNVKTAGTVLLETPVVSIGDDVVIHVIGKTVEIILNGVSAGTIAAPGSDSIAPFDTFGVYRKWQWTSGRFEEPPHIKMGIYEIYYKVDGAYDFRLVPYLGTDGIPFLYEEIAGTKHYPEVCAPFDYILNGVYHSTFADAILPQQDAMLQQAAANLPSRYTALNYITSKTTGRIDTGLLSSSDYLLRFKIFVPYVTGDAIVGDTSGDSNDYRCFNYNGGAYLDISNLRINQNGLMPANNTYNLLIGDMYIYNAEAGATMLYNEKTASTYTPWTGASNIRILRNNNNRGSKIYYFAITDRVTNTPIRVMIPCYDTVGQTYGMYDAITETFFGAEQGSFIGE